MTPAAHYPNSPGIFCFGSVYRTAIKSRETTSNDAKVTAHYT